MAFSAINTSQAQLHAEANAITLVNNATTGLAANLLVWSPMAILYLMTLLLGLLSNVGLLLLCCLDRTLRSPFNVYVTNLIFANVVFCALTYPKNIINTLYRVPWALDDGYCTVFLYDLWVWTGRGENLITIFGSYCSQGKLLRYKDQIDLIIYFANVLNRVSSHVEFVVLSVEA